jgi:hypothetical protein
VCSHTALPLFDLSSVKAELAASKAPKEAVPCWLPPHIGETVTSWARPLEALPLSTATEVGRTTIYVCLALIVTISFWAFAHLV